MVLSTPLDLISALASSEPALAAERERFVSTLGALRVGLESALSASSCGATGVAQFSNAASDLFCQVRLLVSGSSQCYGGIEELAAQVESVLPMLQSGRVQTEAASRLLSVLDAQLEKSR